MKVELSAKGSPAEIIASIGHDVSVARKANDSEAHVLYAVRDYVYRLCTDAGEDAQLAVAVAIEVNVGPVAVPAAPAVESVPTAG